MIRNELESTLIKNEDFTEIEVLDFLDTLTERERVVVQLEMTGFVMREIGEQLGCTNQCISLINQKICRKWVKYNRSRRTLGGVGVGK